MVLSPSRRNRADSYPRLQKQYTSDTASASSNDEEQGTTSSKRRSFLARKPSTKKINNLEDALLKLSVKKSDNDSETAVAGATFSQQEFGSGDNGNVELTYRQWALTSSSLTSVEDQKAKKKKKSWSKLFVKTKAMLTADSNSDSKRNVSPREEKRGLSLPPDDRICTDTRLDSDGISSSGDVTCKTSQSFRTLHSMDTLKKSNVTKGEAEVFPRNKLETSNLSTPYEMTSTSQSLENCASCNPLYHLLSNGKHFYDVKSVQEEYASSKGARSLGPVDVDKAQFVDSDHLSLKRMHSLASDEMKSGAYDEALYIFHEIIRLLIERHGEENNIHVGATWHNIGIVNSKAKRHKEAVYACKKAVQIREALLGKSHQEVAVSLSQLGVAYLDSRQYERALDCFRGALTIREDYFGSHHIKVAKILNNMGCVFFEMNEHSDAESAFKEALDIQRFLLSRTESSSNANSILLSIASTQSNIGSILLKRKEFGDAIAAFDEALVLQQSVLGDTHETVLNTSQTMRHALRLQAEEECCFQMTSVMPFGQLTSYPFANCFTEGPGRCLKKSDAASVAFDREENLCEF
jgi:tetratricopeptide (TPR) repeat protein